MLDWWRIGFFAPDDDAGGGAGVFATSVSVGAAGAFDSGIFFGAAGFSGGGGSALIASGAVRQCVPERDSAVSLGPCVALTADCHPNDEGADIVDRQFDPGEVRVKKVDPRFDRLGTKVSSHKKKHRSRSRARLKLPREPTLSSSRATSSPHDDIASPPRISTPARLTRRSSSYTSYRSRRCTASSPRTRLGATSRPRLSAPECSPPGSSSRSPRTPPATSASRSSRSSPSASVKVSY